MAEKFKVQLVTPKGIMLDKLVDEVIAPGLMGEFGVLSGHTPMLTFIKPGVFSYLENERFIKFVVGQGFCEVLKDSVTCLVDEAYKGDEVDAREAADELAQIEQTISGVDALANPGEHERLSVKLKVARAKVSLSGGS
jgi:F-type H+-transporting ATPase subunit epsilon